MTGGLTPEEEQARAQAGLLGVVLQADNPNMKINKYTTYPVLVQNNSGQFSVKIMEPKPIPQGAKNILNECNKNPFNKELGEAFPGIIPSVHQVPKVFLQRTNDHVKMVNNYFKERENGSTVAILVASATKKYGKGDNENYDYRKEFSNETGINLEALVAAIGVVKTGMGIEGTEKFMFGCGINSTNPNAVANTYSNAYCAVKKLDSYKSNCARDVKCYYTEYNKDSENQQSTYKRMDFTEDFEGIYNKWNVNSIAGSGTSFSTEAFIPREEPIEEAATEEVPA